MVDLFLDYPKKRTLKEKQLQIIYCLSKYQKNLWQTICLNSESFLIGSTQLIFF